MVRIKCIIFGAISKEKGYKRAIDGIKNDKRIELTIVGPLWNPLERPTKDYLMKISKQYDNIIFENRMLPEAKFEEYAKNVDIILFPYLRISQSGMFHRIIRYNKPIIAWKLPFFEEIKNKYKACLTVSSEKELKKKILKISKNKRLREKLINGLKKLRKETSWGNVAKMHIRLYKRL